MGQILKRTSIILGGMNLNKFFAWCPNKGGLFCSNKTLILSVPRIREIQGSKIIRLIHPDVPIRDLRVLLFPSEGADFDSKYPRYVFRCIEEAGCIYEQHRIKDLLRDLIPHTYESSRVYVILLLLCLELSLKRAGQASGKER